MDYSRCGFLNTLKTQKTTTFEYRVTIDWAMVKMIIVWEEFFNFMHVDYVICKIFSNFTVIFIILWTVKFVKTVFELSVQLIKTDTGRKK